MTTATAPIELVLIRFPKNHFRGEILDALEKLVSDGIIRIIDILFVTKNKEGDITVAEMSDLENEDYEAIDPLISRLSGVLSENDAKKLAREMQNDSSAGLMLFEDTWATELSEALDHAGGELVVNERVPRAVLDKLAAEAREDREEQ